MNTDKRNPNNARKKRFIRYALPILIIWNTLFIIDLLLHAGLISNGVFVQGMSTFFVITFLIKASLVSLSLVAVITLVMAFISSFVGNRLRRFIIPIILWPLFLIYGASWYGYKIYGKFYSIDFIETVYHDFFQLYQHLIHTMSAWAIGVPLLLFIVVFIFYIIISSLVEKINLNWILSYFLLNIVIIVFFVSNTFFVGSKILNDHDTVMDKNSNIRRKISEVFLANLEYKSNPIATFYYDLYKIAFPEKITIQSEAPFNVRRNRQISLSEYANRINSNETRKFNIILLLVESLRTDQLIAFGGTKLVMPNTETLAKISTCYTDNYTQASHSNYADICPLSSHYPLRSREMHYYPEKIPYPKVLIYDILKKVGYRTAIISSQNEKWGNMHNYLKSEHLDHFFHSETFKGPTYIPDNDRGFAKFVKNKKLSGKIDDQFTVEESIRWIGKHKSDPFFVYMNLQNSHVPYPIPENFSRKFSPDKIDFQVRFGDFPKDKIDIVKGMYSDSLRYVDHQFGKLIGYLKENDLFDKTIIVVTGDTGQAFYEHGFASHSCPIFDEVMRVPLILYVPGVEHKIDERPAQHIDIPPTLLSLINLPVHPSFQGMDLTGPVAAFNHRSRYILCQTAFYYQHGIVRDHFKLMYTPAFKQVWLYNLETDPRERNNLAQAMPQLTEKLVDQLQAWYAHQIDYYETTSQYSRTYPPRYSDKH